MTIALRPSRKMGRATVVGFAAVGLLLAAQPAEALGTKYVNRSCGTNAIESWNDSRGAHARTTKYSGSCNDVLSVAGVSGSTVGARVSQNSTTNALVEAPGTYTGGRHWGCPSCGYSTT